MTGYGFIVVDQIDVAVGAWLVLFLIVPPTPLRLVGSFLPVGIVHALITVAARRGPR